MIRRTALLSAGAAVLLCAGAQAYAASPLDVGIGVVSGLVLGSILTHPAPVYAEPRVAYYAPQVEYAPPPPVYYYGPPRVDYYSGPPVVVYQRDDDDRCWHRCWRGDER